MVKCFTWRRQISWSCSRRRSGRWRSRSPEQIQSLLFTISKSLIGLFTDGFKHFWENVSWNGKCVTKELGACHKIWFSNLYISATQCCRSYWSNKTCSLKIGVGVKGGFFQEWLILCSTKNKNKKLASNGKFFHQIWLFKPKN